MQEQLVLNPTKCPICGNPTLRTHDLQAGGERENFQVISAAASYRCENGYVFMAARSAC
jgi:hypothetical protein